MRADSDGDEDLDEADEEWIAAATSEDGAIPPAKLAAIRKSINPRGGDGWRALGLAYLGAGHFADALDALTTAARLGALDGLATVAMADCQSQLGERRQARATLRRACRRSDLDAELLPNIARELGTRGEFGLALEVCEALAERVPTSGDAWFGIAFYRDRMGAEPVHLVGPLRRAHFHCPSCWLARLNLAAVLARLGQWNEAGVLVDPVDPAMLSQPCWLHRIADIARRVRNTALASACWQRLAELRGA